MVEDLAEVFLLDVGAADAVAAEAKIKELIG